MAEDTGNEPDGPEALIVAWCKGCSHAASSVPCGQCGSPACANCGRCPSCDGPIEQPDVPRA